MNPAKKLLGIEIGAPARDPGTWRELVDDCARCVSPLRQPLERAGVTDPGLLGLCDTAGTAALLTGLWRDVRVDVFKEGRVYIPRDIAERHGLDLALMVKAVKLDTDRGCDGNQRTGTCDCALLPHAGMLSVRKPYRAAMEELVKRTDRMFLKSRAAWAGLPPVLRRSYRRLTYQGRATLGTIARHNYDTLTRRLTPNGLQRAWIGIRLKLPG